MLPGLHDSLLVAYAVSSAPSELVLSVQPHHGSATGPFRVVFRGVVAHCFPHPLLPAVLHGIAAIPAEVLLRDEWARIERGYQRCGWPGPWADSLDKAIGFAAASDVQAFRIESSHGLEGWVLAESVEAVATGV